jgi:Ca-activated chloride channel family protein
MESKEPIRRAVPWWLASWGIHLALGIVCLLIVVALLPSGRDEELVVISPPAPIQPVNPREVDIRTTELDLAKSAQDPVIYKAAEDDECETPSDEEFEKAVGEALDALSDKPFKGQGIYDVLGSGGSGGGKYGGRFGGKRAAVYSGGGGRDTEDAALNALRWLARHQSADGSWETRGHSKHCGRSRFAGICSPNPGDDGYRSGLTGLALLAFLGAGYTHLSKDTYDGVNFGDVVKQGLQYLMKEQGPDGRVTPDTSNKYMYNQMLGSLALSEAYGLTGSALLKEPAQRAVQFVEQAQNPGAGWRYSARSGESDSSVTGWGAQLAHSARISGLALSAETPRGLLAFLDQATDSKYGRVGYLDSRVGKVVIPGVNERFADHPALTSIGMMSKMFLTGRKTDPAVRAGADLLTSDLPDPAELKRDMYYWYYGSMAMFQFDGPSGPRWKAWNQKLKPALLDTQNKAKGDCRHGSWEPNDRWSSEGGRVYTSAIGALTLEVYYRYPNVIREKKGAGLGSIDEMIRTADHVLALVPTTADDKVTQGTMFAKDSKGEKIGLFPLQHTDVQAKVSGYMAATEVTQKFANPFKEAIEAVYVFPLPSMAAINGFVMEVAGYRVVGVVRQKQEAIRIYNKARSMGRTASLLTQEQPNIFTQRVANIAPGEKVDVKITYFETLKYEDGRYEYVFPMVVAPRYDARPPEAAPSSNPPPSPEPGPAPRSEVQPTVVAPGMRTGHDIALTLDLEAGLSITDFKAVTHDVLIKKHDDRHWTATLSKYDSIPNRDFVASWSVAGAQTKFGALAHRAEGDGHFTLMAQAPMEVRSREKVGLREVTFLVDISGSMNGAPNDMNREIIRRTLDHLTPEELINVVVFESGNGQLWETPRPATAENVAAAKAYVAGLQAGGGTEMLAGLNRALKAKHDPRHTQMYVFMTDGHIGGVEEILKTIKTDGADARFFAVGPGGSVNRYLLDGIGNLGRGRTIYANPHDPQAVPDTVQKLWEMIDAVWLADVTIDWNDMPVCDLYPAKIPDLWAGQVFNIIGRYKMPASGTIYVQGRVGKEKVRVPIAFVLPEKEPANAALVPVWARHRMQDLQNALLTTPEAGKQAVIEEITDLALEYRLMSPYTSFVAVDERRVVGNGRPVTIFQPVELPEGMDREKTVGTALKRVFVPAWKLTLEQGKDGRVRVVSIDETSPAFSGLAAGSVLATVDGAMVGTLGQLESLLLGARGESVQVGFSKTEDPTQARPITLPRP